MARKIFLLFICCSMLVLLAGCGGSKGSAQGDDKPWHLFTKEEAAEVLGFDVEEEISMIDGKLEQRMVVYESASGDEPGFIQVAVAKNTDAKKAAGNGKEDESSKDTDEGTEKGTEDSTKEPEYTVKQLFEEAKTSLADTAQSVDGLGDNAFWDSGALHILNGDYYIAVTTAHEDGSEHLERAKVIAETILDRLSGD